MATRTATAIGLLATAIAVSALPAGAAAEYYVPPSNSAATQYTETFPTAGGHRDSEQKGKGKRSPADVLGERKVRRLREQGAEGREIAEVVAATAPAAATVPQPETGAAPEGEQRDGGDRDGESRERPADDTLAGTGGGTGPSGSSGLGEVLGQATGVSDAGELGLLLPLALAAAAAWALAFFLRKRNRPTP
jgi:hypothetical protein